MSEQYYQPTWDSLNQHKLPAWFMDSKLGIFIHWGVYAVPAFAPPYQPGSEYYNEDIGFHPYSELYGWGMMYKNSPVWKHHVEKYGAEFQYEDFFPMFTAEKWDPNAWAGLFKDVGAKYVVMVTKHSDGYCMWPTDTSPRNCGITGPKRDLTGDLTQAVKDAGLRMGLYYSTTFNYYYDRAGHITYRDLTHRQVKELVDRYDPAILWSDDYWKPSEKSFEETWKSKELMAYFYNHAKDPSQVVANDRWGVVKHGLQLGDYSTPEYRVLPDIPDFYWELTRGIGQSYGYCANDTYLSVEEIIDIFVDCISKNGNMLLNVGPKADGTLDEQQVDRLQGLGEFINRNTEAVYGTRHWVTFDGETDAPVKVRYTCKDGAVYAILLGKHAGKMRIGDLRMAEGAKATLLGEDIALDWTQGEGGLCLTLPEVCASRYANVVKLSPEPFKVMRKKAEDESLYAETFRRTGFLKVKL